MRIINRQEFLKMPNGTVFSYYEPCVFRDLMIKTESWESDFLYDGIIGAIDYESSDDFIEKCERMENGESMPMDFNQTSREGLFEEKQLFAIYELADVEKLIKRLKENGN